MSARLTQLERDERAMLEEHLQRGIVDLAVMLGWDWLHVRPGIRKPGPRGTSTWWTPTVGSLRWWPDLVLVRARDRRLIFAELKRQLEEPSDDQVRVLGTLELAGQKVYVWRPSDFRDPLEESVIGRILA